MPASENGVPRFEAVKAGRHSCANCLRTSLNRMNPGEGVPLDIHCVFSIASSTRCNGCQKKNDSCMPVPGLLLGDWNDFHTMVEWLGEAIEEEAEDEDEDEDEDEEDNLLLDEDVRAALADAQYELGKSFEALEAGHRSLWGITGARKAQGEAPRRYLKAVEARRASLISSTPPLGLNITAKTRKRYAAVTTPRLIEGDPFFAVWGAAKKSFFSAVAAALEDEDMDLVPASLLAADHPVRQVEVPDF